MLVSSCKFGTMYIWDLEKRKLKKQLPFSHSGAITSLQFFEKQPVLLTAGEDNALKQWIFDNANGEPRLLKSRAGHAKPPKEIKFYVSSSMILSGSYDRSLRFFSTVRVYVI